MATTHNPDSAIAAADELGRRVNASFPEDWQQRAVLHYLIGMLADNAEFATAIKTELDYAERRTVQS